MSYTDNQSFTPACEQNLGVNERIDRAEIEETVKSNIEYDCLMSNDDESFRGTGTVPIGVPRNSMKQMSLFDTVSDEQDVSQRKECVIYNWRNSRERAITYNSMKRKDDEL